MSIEDLMQPRYKVVADYPDSLSDIGTIIQENNSSKEWFDSLEDYPHIFKHLEWYEERKVADMPKYVKAPTGRIAKAKFDLNGTSAYFMYLDGEIIPYSPIRWLPATLEEYNAYQSKQKEGDATILIKD